MATDKKRSKGRFPYLFDWNAKSRKKLFSNKSESSEGSNQGKESVDNLVISPYLLRELCENGDRSSFRENGNFSCASSVNGGGEEYVTKAPGVVARLMGLDFMPTTTSCEASSISSYESHAPNSYYYPKGAAQLQNQRHIIDYNYVPTNVESFHWNSVDSRTNKVHGRPIERFQTEVLPPKSAKPISITHHKLLSPIKSSGFVPTKDAAYVMEAAARIIYHDPQPSSRAKLPSLGSPSSFKIQDLKDKMDAAQRSSKIPESSKTPKNSASMQQTRGNSSDRSSNRSLFKNILGSETSSSQKVKNKGKSVSGAVRDKGNEQKKGLAHNENKSKLHKEHKQVQLKQKKPSTQKNTEMRTSKNKSSSVLRQNNDKQNGISHKDRSAPKTSLSEQQPRKTVLKDNSAGPSKIVNRVFVNAENGVTEARAPLNAVSEKRPSLNRIKNITRSKQFSVRDNRLGEYVPENSDERAVQCDLTLQGGSRKDMDVISFTFNSPIKKSGSKSLCSNEATGSDCRHRDGDSYDLRCQPDVRNSLSPPSGLNFIDSGSLSVLLEQKIKELTDKVVSIKSDLVMEGPDDDSVSCLSESNFSHDVSGTSLMGYDEWSDKDQTSVACDDDCSSDLVTKSSQKWEDLEGVEEYSVNGANKCEDSNIACRDFSIPECSTSGSCMSQNTRSDFTHGYDQPLSPQCHEAVSRMSTDSVHPREDETDFTDATSYWELEYIRHMLHYAGLKRFELNENCKIINPGLFDLLENLINTRNGDPYSKLERKILFDCVSKIMSSRYERVFLGSQKAWDQWEMLLENEWLTEEVYKDILCLQNMGNLMVDELVDRDMSIQYGKWVDFEIESLEVGMEIEKEIEASLVNELVADLFI